MLLTFTTITAFASIANAVPFKLSDYINAGIDPSSAGISSPTVQKVQNSTSYSEPCNKIRLQLVAGDGNTYVDVDLAVKCLRSVPLDVVGDKTQLDGLEMFLQFHSTLGILKAPPPGYMYPPVDIIGGLETLRSKLTDGVYTNEWDFQMAVSALLQKSMDGHLSYGAEINSVFGFGYDDNLYSLSIDGQSLPNIYFESDVPLLTQPSTSSLVSPIVEINGQDIEGFLNNFATQYGYFQDPDAAYNNLFPGIPQQSLGSINAAPYPMSNNQIVRFQNGTTSNMGFSAWANQDFSGVVDGKSFFRKFCNASSNSKATLASRSQASASASASVSVPATQVSYTPVPTETALPPRPGFPQPLVEAHDYSVAGYFPDVAPDLAVLSLPSFGSASFTEYQDLTREFLATSHKLGKKKLLIDLRGNPGGWIFQGYDLFKQLFPQKKYYPYGASNLRAHPLFNEMGLLISKHYTENPPSDPEDAAMAFNTVFNYNQGVSISFDDFPSWPRFYGPHEFHGDNFTSLMRYNLSNPIETDWPITGFNNLSHIQPQTFAAEDIVLLHDGACSSTCTIFSEFMKTQMGVQSIAVGGRKRYGPMQGIGGTKGSQDLAFADILQLMNEAYRFGTPNEQEDLRDSVMTPELKAAARHALSRSPSATLNWRNNIREGDTTETPLQFVYEAADCRIWYTPEMVARQDFVWLAVYKARWSDGMCVEGSMGQPSSVSSKMDVNAAPPTADPDSIAS